MAATIIVMILLLFIVIGVVYAIGYTVGSSKFKADRRDLLSDDYTIDEKVLLRGRISSITKSYDADYYVVSVRTYNIFTQSEHDYYLYVKKTQIKKIKKKKISENAQNKV